MPVFETTYGVTGKGPDGQEIQISPNQILRELGPTLQVTISPTQQHLASLAENSQDIPNPKIGIALIDTGASVTAVDEEVCRQLGIPPTGQAHTSHAGGNELRACYPIQLTFPGSPLPQILVPRAMSVNLHVGAAPHILLMGRDILSNVRMVYNGPRGRLEIAF